MAIMKYKKIRLLLRNINKYLYVKFVAVCRSFSTLLNEIKNKYKIQNTKPDLTHIPIHDNL